MYVRLGNLLFALASLVILALAEFADAQVAELPIEREWGIKLAERVRTIKMADIDGDGIEEILVGTGSDSGYVYVIHGITHETEWKSPGLIGRALSIGVGDSNGDSIKEIVVGTGLGASESGNVYIFDGLNHTLEWHKSGFDERVYSIAIGDFDMDDSTEILVGTFYHWHNFGERYVSWGEDGELYILDGSNYSQEIVYSTGVVKRVQIIDINEDGVNESAIGSHKGASLTSDDPIDYGLSEVKVSIRRGIVDLGSRYLFRYDGLPWYPPFPYFLEMTVGNCDSHYTQEIICSYVESLEFPYIAGLKVYNGTPLQLKWSRLDTSSGYPNSGNINGLAVKDLNEDSINDIVAAYLNGYISVIDGITSVDLAVSPQTIPISSFAFGNVDEDEESEACISDGDSLILLEVHSFTGVEDEDKSFLNIPLNNDLSQNYPNPFNSATVIRYSLFVDYPCPTSLKIYNLLGEEVRTLVDKRQRPGYYSVTWEGDDDNGRRLSSGIYFYQLRCGSYSATRKLLYLK